MAKDLGKFAADKGVKFFLFNFTDLFGVQRAKLVPAEAAGKMQKAGAGFAGFATWLDHTPAHPDILVMPDASSVIQLPWRPEVAWVAGEPWMDGEPLAQAPRVVLRNMMEANAKKNLKLMAGVEPEFHLINADGSQISDDRDTQEKPCYDQSAIMRRLDVIGEICSTMTQLGWGPYQNDHEDANGQFEINWNFADALTTADQLAFFKFMVKSIAEKHGFRATFMPKPFINLTGNGCHVHLSMWDKDAKTNLFHDPKGELGLSAMAYNFLGGLINHAASMAAITNPTVNSYKRINAPRTTSGATWSPSSITFGGNNRTHMVRIPDEGRTEYRLPDGAANPYLMLAAILAAGMHGIEEKMNPGKRLDIDMYAMGHTVKNARKLPLNLLDALRNFEKDKYLQNALGADVSAAYLKLKHDDWNKYCRHLTQWERDTTLDI
ncbi:MAG: type III glutamate--ammonia ligase [Rhodobiaceae bacterium]|nr:type III glutamate--ammonia ligase [Rhodobiaceae bacterium]MCC0041442.1 type III glutamate--ammonia ligase [Rhodobiaceae bacterium]MCC0053796.1 type III glutamate--ammonia ligase [Rhodobiaceae bacterium]